MSSDREKALQVALLNLMPYRRHRRSCDIEETDVCTCGLKEAADEARTALKMNGGVVT